MKRYLTPILSIVGLLAVIGSQALYDHASGDTTESRRKARFATSEPLLPTPQALKALSLGMPQVVADLLWVQTIQYFGSGNPYGNYPSLGKILDTITQLDTQFQRPYEFGLIVLPYMRQTDGAVALGARSEKEIAFGKRGYLDFEYASVHLLSTKNYAEAARLYKLSAQQPDHPGAADTLAGTALNRLEGKGDEREAAIEYWRSLKDRTSDPDLKEQYYRWELHMTLVQSLEQKAQEFKSKEGRYPSSLQELVDKGYVGQIPESPVGRKLSYDSSNGTISFDELVGQ